MTVVRVANSMWYVVRRKTCCMVQTTGQTACGRCLEWRRRKRKRNLSCVQHRVVVPPTLQTLTARRECSGQLCFHSRVTSPPCVVLDHKIVGPCGKNSASLHTARFLFCPTSPLEPTPSKSAYPLRLPSSPLYTEAPAPTSPEAHTPEQFHHRGDTPKDDKGNNQNHAIPFTIIQMVDSAYFEQMLMLPTVCGAHDRRVPRDGGILEMLRKERRLRLARSCSATLACSENECTMDKRT